jgi:hypothetical protein
MDNRLAVALLAVLMAGCATSRETYTADGQKGHSINCSGNALTWGMCSEKAGELCGAKGYDVLERSGDQGAVASGSKSGFFAGTVTSRSMIVRCKP